MSLEIQGVWSNEWQPVVDVFAEQFSQGEVGAGVAVHLHGRTVLNVWAGTRANRDDDVASTSWQENTLVNVFSAGKGLVALCALQLVDKGLLSLNAPVAKYWPEFGEQGKNTIRVRDILCHRSGLSAFHQTLPSEAIFAWESMCAEAASETPWWRPNEGQGYSPFMYGWIMGEIIRRASGAASFDAYFQQHVAQMVNARCFFGVPEAELVNIADTAPLKKLSTGASVSSGADSIALGQIMKSDPRGVTNRAFSNPLSLMTATNSRAWRTAQIPAANAHATADALATIYGNIVSGKLLSAESLALCYDEQTFEQDRVLGLPLRFSNGFMLSQADRADCRYGYGERGFGHPGAGGCLGFADPDRQLGFGYVTNRMGQRILIDERAVKLIDAVYRVMGVN
jgi:CubicO group peptidase (beta-lactamase class C family)